MRLLPISPAFYVTILCPNLRIKLWEDFPFKTGHQNLWLNTFVWPSFTMISILGMLSWSKLTFVSFITSQFNTIYSNLLDGWPDLWVGPFIWRARMVEEVTDGVPFSYSDFSDTIGQTFSDDRLDHGPSCVIGFSPWVVTNQTRIHTQVIKGYLVKAKGFVEWKWTE